MGQTNINTLWGQLIANELARSGIEHAVIAPGSRSTPLTVAISSHPNIEAVSHLDERSAAFFALGYAKRTGHPAPLVCTSGTALANFHPAVIEADAGRVPMLLLTADRPPELADSGANQTIDQEKFYGDAVRHYRTLPEPEAADRKIRSLWSAIARGVETARGPNAGPVHFNVPFRKPLEPNVDPSTVPAGVPDGTLPVGFERPFESEALDGQEPFVRTIRGTPLVSESDQRAIVAAIESAERGLIVCGPSNEPRPTGDVLRSFSRASGFPIIADPLSGHRFGDHIADVTVCGGYDSYLPAIEMTPDVVIRFGAAPTSKALQQYLQSAESRQFLIDPAGGWRAATFTPTTRILADETQFAIDLTTRLDREAGAYASRLADAESTYWQFIDSKEPPEGAILADVVRFAPDPSTLFVSNSMPVRDLDRFGKPRAAALTVLGNRGASGIDGITSTALGSGYGTDDPLVLVTGDLAYYHDMNGLIAVARASVDATIVCINNDGGGIFHLLPIKEHDSFDRWFRTPHGLPFEHAAALYDLEFARTDDRDRFRELYATSIESDGTQVIEFTTDAERNHLVRRQLERSVCEHLST